MTEIPRTDNPEVRHEPSDVSHRVLVIWGLSLAALIGMIALGSWLLFDLLQGRQQRSQPPPLPLAVQERQKQERLDPAGTPAPPEWSNTRGPAPLPRNPRLEGFEAQTDATRGAPPQTVPESYRWVDRQEGIVQIPLEQALRLLVEQKENAPPGARTDAETTEKFPTLPSRASSGRSSIGRNP
jgi:hypothetical protein